MELEANCGLTNAANKTALDLAKDSLKKAEKEVLDSGKKLPVKAVKGTLIDKLTVTVQTLEL